MNHRILLCCATLLTLSFFPSALQAQKNYPPEMKDAKAYVYKQVGEVELKAFVYEAKGDYQGPRPAIVFFFGGGWRSGSPKQFEQHARYLAERGMVAICADYRVASRHQVKAVACVEDAKSAIRWVRKNAGNLGIDAQRIVAAGGSAGGHLAACTSLAEQIAASDDDVSISAKPNAMALFNPALVLSPVAENKFLDLNIKPAKKLIKFEEKRMEDLQERAGIELTKISPFHQLPASTGPCIIFHGQSDTTVPYESAELFAAAMQEAGNRCELVGFPGKSHGFFNFGRDKNASFRETLASLDRFLVSLEYLPAEKSAAANEILNQ